MFLNCMQAENEFEKCWNNPRYTAIQLDDVDVNHVLSYYAAQRSIYFTKTMLWDMETKKAWNPENYISYVMKAGSAQSWHKHPCSKTGGEIFVRCSAQKKWLEPSIYENVYEEVYVNKNSKLITLFFSKIAEPYQTSLNGRTSISNDHADGACCVNQKTLSATSSGLTK